VTAASRRLAGNEVPLLRSIALSIGFHLALAAPVVLGLAELSKPDPVQSSSALVVAPVIMASAAPPRPVATGPMQVEAHPKPKSTPKIDIPAVPRLRAKAAIEIAPKLKAKKSRSAQPHEETTAPSALPIPSNENEATARAAGSPNISAANAEQTWEGLVLAELERRKSYPNAAKNNGEEDLVYVCIAVDTAGNVVRSTIVSSKHYALLDKAVLDLVRRASPLPPPPAQAVPGSMVEFVVPVEFFINRSARD
jgi:periplasmic protein TonB